MIRVLFPNGSVQNCHDHYPVKTETAAERLAKEIEASMRGQGYYRLRLDGALGYLTLFPHGAWGIVTAVDSAETDEELEPPTPIRSKRK